MNKSMNLCHRMPKHRNMQCTTMFTQHFSKQPATSNKASLGNRQHVNRVNIHCFGDCLCLHHWRLIYEWHDCPLHLYLQLPVTAQCPCRTVDQYRRMGCVNWSVTTQSMLLKLGYKLSSFFLQLFFYGPSLLEYFGSYV
jgi:hypothetical protein